MGGCSSQLDAAKKINSAANVKGTNSLCFGATAGIGEAMAKNLASLGSNVTIVGRNQDAGKLIVDEMKKLNPTGQYEFVKADLSLLENCKKVCSDYVSKNSRLDYVVFTQTKATFQGLTKTKEGIDEKLGLNYYTRIYMTNLLLPLLRKTADEQKDSDPRVLSVLAAGMHSPYENFKEDPYLEKNYSSKNAADYATFQNDLSFDKLSKMDENKGKVTFGHVYPGFVDTNWGSDMNFLIRGPIRALQATVARSAPDCAQMMCRALLDPSYRNKADKPSVMLLNEYGENTAPKTKAHNDENMDFVWTKTLELLSEAEKTFAGKKEDVVKQE